MNQRFYWAHTDLFLDFLLFAVRKWLTFWAHSELLKPKEGTLVLSISKYHFDGQSAMTCFLATAFYAFFASQYIE